MTFMIHTLLTNMYLGRPQCIVRWHKFEGTEEINIGKRVRTYGVSTNRGSDRKNEIARESTRKCTRQTRVHDTCSDLSEEHQSHVERQMF